MKGNKIFILIIGIFLTGCIHFYYDTGENEEPSGKLEIWAFYAGDWKGVSIPDSVRVPHKWPNKRQGAFGHGMYKAKLPDPGKYENLSIRMPNIISAFAFMVNEDTIRIGGKPSITPAGEQIRIDSDVVQISRSYYESGEPLDLTIIVSNHNYHTGGLLTPLYYGEYVNMHHQEVKQTLLSGIQAGALGLMGIFLFVYYAFRRKETYILFFSVLSLSLMLRVLIVEDFHILELIPGLNGTIFLKLVLITFYVAVTLNYAVLTGLFPDIIPRWSRNMVLVIGGLSIVFIMFTPLRIGSYSVPLFQLFTVVAGAILIGLTLKAALRHRKGAKTVLIGGIIAMVFLVNDILFNNQIISTGDWSTWGVLIYLFLLIIVISRRFSSAMENEEGLQLRLERLKNDLEIKVQERTRYLARMKEQIEQETDSVKRANDELRKFKEEEQSLLRVLVHDLKSPFNKIKGIAQILRMNEKYQDGEEGELNEMILKIAEEGRLLIDDLNVLTMYEAHLNDLDSYREICIDQLLQDCVRSHTPYAQSKDIEVNYKFNHQVKSWINPNMLSRIVDNLLSNAIKFSSRGGRVGVELIDRKTSYEIVVCDNGPGFTEEDKNKLYGKFQRLSARPTQGESSTGLGLNIVKNLTNLMGGRIALDSSPGEGSCFYLLFPIRKEGETIRKSDPSFDTSDQ